MKIHSLYETAEEIKIISLLINVLTQPNHRDNFAPLWSITAKIFLKHVPLLKVAKYKKMLGSFVQGGDLVFPIRRWFFL